MTERPTLDTLRRRVHKERHREIGNWPARYLARPSAVYGTWLALRLGLSAHQVTALAIVANLGGAGAIATGTRFGFVAGVVTLILAFWLDHVDGQVARWRGTASLDGVYLDYLMHHVAAISLGFALGQGLAMRLTDPRWSLAGCAIALGWMCLSLHNDCRYKAFFQRLKRETCRYRVVGGSGGRPTPAARWPKLGRGLLTWPAYKICEPHVVLVGLIFLAVVAVLEPARWLEFWRGGVLAMAILAPLLAIGRADAGDFATRNRVRVRPLVSAVVDSSRLTLHDPSGHTAMIRRLLATITLTAVCGCGSHASHQMSMPPAPHVEGSITDRVILLVASQVGVPVQNVDADTQLDKDLGFDDLDRVELMMELEEEFGITIDDQTAATVATVGDIVRAVSKQTRKGPTHERRHPHSAAIREMISFSLAFRPSVRIKSEWSRVIRFSHESDNMSRTMVSNLLGLGGAVIGGVVGYAGFRFAWSRGFYAMILPGGLLGLGCGGAGASSFASKGRGMPDRRVGTRAVRGVADFQVAR